VYVYRFTRKVPATGEYVKYGAFHTGEVPYAYDNLKFVNRPWEPVDHPGRRDVGVLGNFARSGHRAAAGYRMAGLLPARQADRGPGAKSRRCAPADAPPWISGATEAGNEENICARLSKEPKKI
jgi:hypothetical protein